jgi:hypothetical protein
VTTARPSTLITASVVIDTGNDVPHQVDTIGAYTVDALDVINQALCDVGSPGSDLFDFHNMRASRVWPYFNEAAKRVRANPDVYTSYLRNPDTTWATIGGISAWLSGIAMMAAMHPKTGMEIRYADQ